MIIPINVLSESSKDGPTFPPQLAELGTEEVILIELQGSFQVEGDKSGQLAATLRMDENTTKPTMFIGHHLLEGKIVNLSKPLAVLEKKVAMKAAEESASAGDMDVDSAKVDKDDRSVQYDIVAVVKRKILFSKRPMPIINMANVTPDTRKSGKS